MRDYLQLREVVDGRRRGGYADRMVIVPQDKRNLCLEKKEEKKKEKKEKNGQGGKMREKRRKRGGIVTRDLKSTTEIFEIDDSYASTRRRMGKRCAVKTAFAHRHRPFSIVVASLIRRPTTTDRNLVIRQRNTISDFSFRARCLSRSRCFFRSRLSVRRFIR